MPLVIGVINWSCVLLYCLVLYLPYLVLFCIIVCCVVLVLCRVVLSCLVLSCVVFSWHVFPYYLVLSRPLPRLVSSLPFSSRFVSSFLFACWRWRCRLCYVVVSCRVLLCCRIVWCRFVSWYFWQCSFELCCVVPCCVEPCTTQPRILLLVLSILNSSQPAESADEGNRKRRRGEIAHMFSKKTKVLSEGHGGNEAS
jgi:hypothetical protein